ncbi:MAG TPA: 50S ribosomal protein L23 [Candidatus Taylorbacteria bacterium]|nr:50S ribosomal protein L23 [Candidatus Taylorbacteria bacterium]
MSFLNLRKTKKEAPEPAKKLPVREAAVKKSAAVQSASNSAVESGAMYVVLRHPRVTEKASAMSERGAYVFGVSKTANKREIAKAVRLFYNVTPVKVRVVTMPPKRVFIKGRIGFRGGGKKSYVYLKPGQKIEIV